jgi:hypothetical protein
MVSLATAESTKCSSKTKFFERYENDAIACRKEANDELNVAPACREYRPLDTLYNPMALIYYTTDA